MLVRVTLYVSHKTAVPKCVCLRLDTWTLE